MAAYDPSAYYGYAYAYGDDVPSGFGQYSYGEPGYVLNAIDYNPYGYYGADASPIAPDPAVYDPNAYAGYVYTYGDDVPPGFGPESYYSPGYYLAPITYDVYAS